MSFSGGFELSSVSISFPLLMLTGFSIFGSLLVAGFLRRTFLHPTYLLFFLGLAFSSGGAWNSTGSSMSAT
ncbi:hypothetical protein Hanom_Chr13g01187641 [Helianthus anomalus]